MNNIAYISGYHANNIWNKYFIDWNGINPDVNIVVGINGAGKTTMLEHIYDFCAKAKKHDKFEAAELLFIPSIDNIVKADNRSKNTALTQMLLGFLQKDTTSMTLMQYRMQILDVPEKAKHITTRIDKLIKVLNELFVRSNKRFEFEQGGLAVKNMQGEKIDVEMLSSGEKHMLIILLAVFLQDERTALVLMDEPENTMHISWQRQLVEILVDMNPNAQFIITTHSPSLFGAGWGDKVVYMEDLIHL